MDARIIEVPQNIEELSAAELEKLDEDELEAYLLKIETQIHERADQMQKREAYIKKMQEESEKQNERKAFLEARVKEIDVKIDASKTKTASLGKDIEELHTKIELAEEIITSKDKKIQQIDKEYNENEVKLASLDKKIDRLGSEIISLDRKKEELRQERQDIIDKAFAPIDQGSPKKDSPLSSRSSTPPSRASSDDEFVSDLSDLSLSRRGSSSSDELEKEKSKQPSSPVPPPRKLSSSAIMSAALPPLPSAAPHLTPLLVSAGQVQPVIVDKSLQLTEEQKKQAFADKDRAFALSEKDKNLVSKIGLNKDKSAPLSQQSSSIGVTPSIQQKSVVFVR